MIRKYLDKNNLIICPNSLKKSVIKEINSIDGLIAFKVIDLNEFMDNYFFTYNKKTIYYVMNKLNCNCSIALDYIKSLYYVSDKEYSYNRLNVLLSIKKELIDNKLLEFNNNFKYYLDNVKIIVYGYDLDPFYKEILSSYNTTYLDITYTKKDRSVLEFNTIYEEVSYVVSDIKNKLDNNYNISNIIVIASSEYTNTIKSIFNIANIPIDLVNKMSLYNLSVSKTIISLLKEDKTFEEIICVLEDSEYHDKIINIFNNYIDFDIETSNLVDLITYDLKNTYINSKHKNNAIVITNFDNIDDNDFIYVLGFNKENYPKLHKDEDFLSDSIKEELHLYTSNDLNRIELNKLRNNIYKDNNYLITYKLKDSFNSYNPCLLIEEDNMNVIRNNKISYNFSNLFNKIALAKEYDNFYKYGIISEELKLLKSNYNDISYNTYDNSFTGLDNNYFLNSFDKISLSYSNIDNFFRCSFRYYLSNILKIDDYDTDEFYMQIGNIFHYVLSKYRESDFSFDKYWNEEASKYTFTLDKLIFLDKLKQELKYDIEIIKKQENYNSLNKYLFENRFFVDIKNDKNKKVTFTGVIDKIIYDQFDDKNYVSVVDYKTGTLPSNLSNTIYGIGMQLPIYLFLIKRSELFPNSEIVGFYLQKIINKDMKRTINKSIDELKENALKLVGYSNCSPDIISKFDMTYHNSNLISGLRQKEDGDFYSTSKVLNSSEINELVEMVSNKIEEGTKDILNSKFNINPKRVDNSDIGCEFCSYRDICFKKEKDYIDLEKHNNLDFLGGDSNA